MEFVNSKIQIVFDSKEVLTFDINIRSAKFEPLLDTFGHFLEFFIEQNSLNKLKIYESCINKFLYPIRLKAYFILETIENGVRQTHKFKIKKIKKYLSIGLVSGTLFLTRYHSIIVSLVVHLKQEEIRQIQFLRQESDRLMLQKIENIAEERAKKINKKKNLDIKLRRISI